MNYQQQICSNCVMDTTDTKITFNNEGICDHCETFYSDIKPKWNTGEKGHNKLIKIVKQIKKEGKNRDFDCIMGMSGGVDSSYLLYMMKKY